MSAASLIDTSSSSPTEQKALHNHETKSGIFQSNDNVFWKHNLSFSYRLFVQYRPTPDETAAQELLAN